MRKRKSGMAPRSKWVLPALTAMVALWGLALARKRKAEQAQLSATAQVIHNENAITSQGGVFPH